MELEFLLRDDGGLEFDGNDDGEKWMDLRDILIFPTAYDTDRWEQGHDANGKVPRLLQVTTYKNIFEHYAKTEEQDSNTTST